MNFFPVTVPLPLPFRMKQYIFYYYRSLSIPPSRTRVCRRLFVYPDLRLFFNFSISSSVISTCPPLEAKSPAQRIPLIGRILKNKRNTNEVEMETTAGHAFRTKPYFPPPPFRFILFCFLSRRVIKL